MRRIPTSANFAILVALASILALAGCSILGIGAKGVVEVTGHRTAPMDIGEIVSYTATNTGSLRLVTLDMEFRVRYQDGTSYRESWSESELEPGASVSGECWVNTDKAGAPIESVDVLNVHWTTW